MKIAHRNPNVLLLGIFIGFLNLTSLTAEMSETFCYISNATMGETTTITCHFGVDVGKLKELVQVIHQINGNFETPVLTCMWEHSKISCVIRKSYIFDGNISDTLQLQIPNVTRAHEGKYACILMTQSQWDYRFCDFFLYNGIHNSTSIDVTMAPATKCFQSNTTEIRVYDEENYHYFVSDVVIACSITVVVIAVIAFIAFLLFCFVKRMKKKQSEPIIEMTQSEPIIEMTQSEPIIEMTQSEPNTEMNDDPLQLNEGLLSTD